MTRRPLLLLALALAASAHPQVPQASQVPRLLTDPPSVPREMRAAWRTPMWDRGFRDWPSVAGLSPDSQRAELRATLDRAAAAGLNAIILHVRVAGDAIYPSRYAPWSVLFTGTSGVAPSPAYDPLAFAVEEAHARGLQLHAWFNPFRAMLPNVPGKMAPTHVTRGHPEWIRKYGAQTWIDPGDPAARKFVLESILDVVKRYDIDGIHLDDYFYPYRESRTVTRRVRRRRVRERREIPFPDDKTWKKFGRGKGWSDRDAWRRGNIDDFISSLYKGVKQIKPAVLVGISPFGIWRPGSPPGITGLDAYAEIYADSRRWLREGWLDYIAPQLYWQLSGAQDRFRSLDAWWRSENPRGRFVWPAIYTSHVYGGGDAWPMDEISAQIEAIRASRAGTTDIPGHIHFRLAALFANGGLLAGQLARDYTERALVPAFPWLGSTAPGAPEVSLLETDGPAAVVISPGDSVHVRWWLIQTRGRDGKWTWSLRPAGAGQLTAGSFGTADPDEVAVTAIGDTGIASTATIVAP
jgi:uncharacterized lipoprotein YddW (UPF0748 family)